MENTNETVVETVDVETEDEVIVLSDNQKLAAAEQALALIPSTYSTAILSEDWKAWNVEEIMEFVLEFHVFMSNVNELRSTLDKAIWAGHADGTVDPSVESIREQPDATNKRGRKAVELTAAQRALKKLGK